MGICLDIRREQKENWATQAWLQQLPPCSSKGRVLYQDKLCKMHDFAFIPGRRANGLRTGNDIAELIISDIYDHFVNKPSDVRILIINFDDDDNTPIEKLKEQENRTKKKATYPVNIEFCDEGVVVEQPLEGVREVVYQTELIDLDKVLNTRGARKKLWRYVLENLKKRRLPKQATVIFNFDKSGPWLFREGAAEHRTDWAHAFGEADTALSFFMYLFKGWDFVFETVDTDYIPITAAYLSSAPEDCLPRTLIWRYKDRTSKTVQLVDMKRLLKDTLEATGLTAQQFIVACVLCKTDFYDKSLISNQMGAPVIFDAVRASKSSVIPRLISSFSNEDEKQGVQELELFARLLLTLTLKSHKDIPQSLKQLTEQKKRTVFDLTDGFDIDEFMGIGEATKRIKLDSIQIERKTTMIETRFSKEYTKIDESKIWEKRIIQGQLSSLRLSKWKYPTQDQLETAYKQLGFNLHYWLVKWQTHTLKRVQHLVI